MATKGSSSKLIASEKILNTFKDSFLYNDGKEIRIPMIEDGVEIQLKCVLTCAKENVTSGGDVAIPGAAKTEDNIEFGQSTPEKIQMTQEEKDNVQRLMETLGL